MAITGLQAVVNEEYLDSLKEAMGEFFDELKMAFIEDGVMLMDQLDSAMQSGDASQVSMSAHTLKSSGKNMGADTLADICAKVEWQSAEGNLEGLDEPIRDMKKELQAVIAYLEETC